MRYAALILFVACGPRPRAFNTPVLPANGAWAGGQFDASLCPRTAPPLYRCTSSPQAKVALAVCGDLEADNTLTIDARASSPADLWVSGVSRNASPLAVAGSFFSQGTVTAPNTETVGGDFRTGGDWLTSAPVDVSGDATVSGTLTANNSVSVGGTLTSSATSGPGAVTAGTTHSADVPFTSPLACAQEPVVADFVADTLHDAGAENLVPHEAFSNISEPTDITFGCGRYHLSALTANNRVTIHIAGATVLVIDGNVHIASPTQFDIADGASLDLVIGGDLAIDNTLAIGDSAHPAWVAVGGSIRAAAPFQLYGTLLAPTSAVAGDNTISIWGAAMVGALRVASPMEVHDGPALSADGCVL